MPAKPADSPNPAERLQTAHWYTSRAAAALLRFDLDNALEYLDLAQNTALELAESLDKP